MLNPGTSDLKQLNPRTFLQRKFAKQHLRSFSLWNYSLERECGRVVCAKILCSAGNEKGPDVSTHRTLPNLLREGLQDASATVDWDCISSEQVIVEDGCRRKNEGECLSVQL